MGGVDVTVAGIAEFAKWAADSLPQAPARITTTARRQFLHLTSPRTLSAPLLVPKDLLASLCLSE